MILLLLLLRLGKILMTCRKSGVSLGFAMRISLSFSAISRGRSEPAHGRVASKRGPVGDTKAVCTEGHFRP